jgi:hypothetical protein
VVVSLLQREARALAAQINPFDRTLRRPADVLSGTGGKSTEAAPLGGPL